MAKSQKSQNNSKRQKYEGRTEVERISELSHALMHHRFLYEKGTPELSDADYDLLEDELRELAPAHPALSHVGAKLLNDLPKVRHEEPMLSLNKTYNIEDLMDWVGHHETLGMLKIDGVSLALIYEDGELTLAKTRGNGQLGEDVTQKIRWIAGILPKVQREGAKKMEIRGEICCTQSNFMRLAQQMILMDLEKPTSPRNIVAGLLGRKTHFELCRYFDFYAFSAFDRTPGKNDFEDEKEQFDWLKKMGFSLPEPELLKNHKDHERYLAHVKKMMDEDEIPIDGAVFSYRDRRLHRELGNTAHHPRAKISFKWQGQSKETIVKAVEWSTSRLGVVTPVAVIEPVFLSGATITNVTLHNAQYVQTYQIKAGDQIEVVRSGEVIPKFLRVIKSTSGEISLPKNCPSCSGKLIFDDVRLRCTHVSQCPAQRSGAVLNWIRAVEIEELSDKRLQSMMDIGLVSSPPDLYRLRMEDLLTLPQTKEKLAQKLLASIQKTKSLPLERFLLGLGIEGMGLSSWEKLLDAMGEPSFEDVLALSQEDILKIHGFAEKSAGDLTAGLLAKKELAEELFAVGVAIAPRAPKKANKTAVSGRTFVITGTLSAPRDEIAHRIKLAGGKVSGAVSSSTFALVTNDKEAKSTKLAKARELGIKMIDEKELEALLNGGREI